MTRTLWAIYLVGLVAILGCGEDDPSPQGRYYDCTCDDGVDEFGDSYRAIACGADRQDAEKDAERACHQSQVLLCLCVPTTDEPCESCSPGDFCSGPAEEVDCWAE